MALGDALGAALGGGMKKGPMKGPMVEVEVESGEAPEGEADMAGLEMAAQDFLDAQSAGNAAGVAAAFKAMHAICNSYSDEME